MTILLLVLAAGVWAGAQNALAGGGSFITLPTLILSGMDARAANITSCVALFPGQIATGWAGREGRAGIGALSFGWLLGLSLVGGVIGAVLLLFTPSSFFARLVPWLVLFATVVFAWGSFRKKPEPHLVVHKPVPAGIAQFLIAIYGGYFGGGIGFLMLAALTLFGQTQKAAYATKNVLAAVMNASAVLIFVFSPDMHWRQAGALAVGAIAGGLLGAWALRRVNEKILRAGVVLIGVALTIGLFLKPV
jgi:uncharacterized membrane protein YfcA